jgi:hypothetical protein
MTTNGFGMVMLAGAAALVFGAFWVLDELGFIDGRLGLQVRRTATTVIVVAALAIPGSLAMGMGWFVDRKVAEMQPMIDRMIEQIMPTTTLP